jgi:hypothetical protein
VPTYPSSSLYPSSSTFPGDVLDPEDVVVAHVRDRPPLRESTEIVTPSGKRYRWASDEPQAENVPRDERWSDIMPGGFETLDQTLPRKPSIDYSDLERLSRVTRYDASGNVIWQGRLERAPRVSGEQMAISPSAVGYQAHLEDDKSVCVVFVDRDGSGWQDPGRARLVALATANAAPQTSPSMTSDAENGLPSLRLEVQGAWASPYIPACETWYDAGAGSAAASVYYDFSGDSNTSFNLVGFSADTDDATDETSGDLYSAATGSGTYTPATARRYLGWSWQYSATSAGTDGAVFYVDLRRLAVFGDHGLTKRGTAPSQGFYDGDAIGHALSRWCPQLSYTDESLVADSFVIPHLAFKDSTTVGEIIKQATRFRLRDWAIWEGPLFWLHDRNARGNKWRARVGPTQLEETGPQVDRLWNSIIVQYQDVDGSTRTVGPTGSGVDTESAYLVDDDPENPANKAGIIRRDLLTMGVSTPEGAVEVGRRFLEQSKQLDSSGRARIVGHVQDDRGVWHPYSHVRAGDQIAFVDASDSGYRRIVKTDKSRSDRTCSIDLDAPPEGLQALLERLGVILVPLGL